jgi:ESS family glutamate:Na+ symporter
MTQLFFSLCVLGLFLLIGHFIRISLKLIQNLFIPASITAGFLGLILGRYGLDILPRWIIDNWAPLPGILISVVFACLFLGVELPSPKTLWNRGGSQLCFGVITGLGQYAVALLLCITVLTPFFGVPAIFATILEIGFSGGHGTASGMQSVFESLNYPAGSALGMMSATVGLLVAVIGGVIIINFAIRRGHCTLIGAREGIPEYKKIGLIKNLKDRTNLGTATVAGEAIEPLAFHFSIVAGSVLIGWGLLTLIQSLHPILKSFPLFPLAMIGGLLIQLTSSKTGFAHYFDRPTFERILGFSLDVLVVAAIASMRLDLFLQYVLPFSLLMIVGILWLLFCLLYLAPRMFRQNWFERGITEYGMQSGVTAIGLLLLRLVDPHYRTDTASAFGFKQMVYEPFLGGGLITALSPFLIIQLGAVYSLLIALGIMGLFFAIARLNGWWRAERTKN